MTDMNAPVHPIQGLCELLVTARPSLIRQARTASAGDINFVKVRLALAFDLFRSVVKEEMGRLNENMPLDALVEVKDLFDGLADIKSDLIGRLEAAEER